MAFEHVNMTPVAKAFEVWKAAEERAALCEQGLEEFKVATAHAMTCHVGKPFWQIDLSVSYGRNRLSEFPSNGFHAGLSEAVQLMLELNLASYVETATKLAREEADRLKAEFLRLTFDQAMHGGQTEGVAGA